MGVRWQVPGPRTAFGYHKVGLRKADAISVVSVAVSLEVDDDGHCRRARIALGSVAPCPLRALAAEECLHGQALSEDIFTAAGKLAGEAILPISDLRASMDYRRRMVFVLVHRLLAQAAGELMVKHSLSAVSNGVGKQG
jgi:CO/xanthine dehydrogenase FAD-binding subunit